MTHTEIRANRQVPGTSISGWKLGFSPIMEVIKEWRQAAARRRTLSQLTCDQLDDIGHQRPNLPTLEVKAGLIIDLMSMR